MQWPIFNYYKMRTNQFQMAPLDMSGKRERPTAKVDNVAFSAKHMFFFGFFKEKNCSYVDSFPDVVVPDCQYVLQWPAHQTFVE